MRLLRNVFNSNHPCMNSSWMPQSAGVLLLPLSVLLLKLSGFSALFSGSCSNFVMRWGSFCVETNWMHWCFFIICSRLPRPSLSSSVVSLAWFPPSAVVTASGGRDEFLAFVFVVALLCLLLTVALLFAWSCRETLLLYKWYCYICPFPSSLVPPCCLRKKCQLPLLVPPAVLTWRKVKRTENRHIASKLKIYTNFFATVLNLLQWQDCRFLYNTCIC